MDERNNILSENSNEVDNSERTTLIDVVKEEITEDEAHSVEDNNSNNELKEDTSPVHTSPDINSSFAQSSDIQEKKNNIVPLLIGVIAILLVGVGVLGGVLLSKNNKTKSNNVIESTQPTTGEIVTTEPTVNSSDILKAANTALIEMDEENPGSVEGLYIISSDETCNFNVPTNKFEIDDFYKKLDYYFDKSESYKWFILVRDGYVESAAIGNSWEDKAFESEDTLQDLYDKTKAIIDNDEANNSKQSDQFTADEVSYMYSTYISENPDPNHRYDDPRYGYALIDLNNDGAQELLITCDPVEEGSPSIVGAYVINNKKLTQLWITDQRFLGALCENNIISSYSAMGSGGGTALYQYKSGNSLELVDMVSFDYSSGKKVMYHNQDVVSETEADAILAQYKNMKFEAKPLKILAQSEPKIETTTLAAQNETYAFYGVVATDSGTLNLRDKPSTDSNVITQLEKGTKGSVYRIDGYSDWYKMYTDSGQEGYVSSQYIKEYFENQINDSPIKTATQMNTDGSSVDPSGIKFVLNADTPMEFSNYDNGTLISTIRVDKVEYEIVNFTSQSKRNDNDYGKFYVKLYFYLTKTYDRYASEDRYSMNPHLYFKITNLTTNKSILAKSCDGKATSFIGYYDVLKREGDTEFYEWYSREDLHDEYGNGIQVYRDSEYMITIMDYAEMCRN